MKIAFLGDSLTEGRPGESFLTRLRGLLPGDELLNYGRAGDTIPDLLRRTEHMRMEESDLAFVWVGANDAFLGGWELPSLGGGPRPDPLSDSYSAVLEITLRHAPRVVCVPPVLPDLFEEGGFTRRVEEITAMIADAVAGSGGRALLFDLRPEFARAAIEDPRKPFTIDGVHLAVRGADVVAASFRTLIDSLRAD
jgi:lysophospholipase L1-like esterase